MYPCFLFRHTSLASAIVTSEADVRLLDYPSIISTTFEPDIEPHVCVFKNNFTVWQLQYSILNLQTFVTNII